MVRIFKNEFKVAASIFITFNFCNFIVTGMMADEVVTLEHVTVTVSEAFFLKHFLDFEFNISLSTISPLLGGHKAPC